MSNTRGTGRGCNRVLGAYASYGMVSVLPIQLSCTMDFFGIITRTDWLLSPAAKVVLQALKTAAVGTYDYEPSSV